MGSNNLYTLITGASAGIGKEFAREFAKRKNNLFLIALPETGLEECSAKLQQEFDIDVKFLNIDLTEYKSPEKVLEFANTNGIKINVLVNNAGVGYNGEFSALSYSQIDTMLLLNVRASTLLLYLFLPEMQKLDEAYILNVSSFAGMSPIPYKSLYSATKGFVLYLSRALSFELKPYGIKVLAVYPSGVRTQRTLEIIKNSSLFARITSLAPHEVAEQSVAALYNGEETLIPGGFTRFYYFLGSIMPQGLVLKLTNKIFRKYA